MVQKIYRIGRNLYHLAPAVVLLAILAGLTLGGLVGALLAIPIVALLRRWMDRLWLTSPGEDPSSRDES